MSSRRHFITTIAAGLGATAARRLLAGEPPPEVKTALNGPVGLQLWSLRAYLPKDLSGTLTKIRNLGIVEVEAAGLWGHPLADFRAGLDTAGLKCRAGHVNAGRLENDLAGTFKELETLGAEHVVCPWLPHDPSKGLQPEDVAKGAELFNRVGKAARAEGKRFSYHCHGYEFVPSPDGTLFDTFAKATDPELVGFEIDVFWAKAGGADPAKLIAKYADRVDLLHVKGMKKGLTFPAGSSGAPPDADVPIGTGQLDWPAVFRACAATQTRVFYLEDESPDPLGSIPKSLEYLQSLEL